MTSADAPTRYAHRIAVADLKGRSSFEVVLEPDAEARAMIAEDLGIDALRKARFAARLSPAGKRDWRLTAELGATVVQPCVVTLAPVTTRIDEPVERLFRAEMAQEDDAAADAEVEMPDDVSEEPLGGAIDLGRVMSEALALALPLYPRAADAEMDEANFTEPGKAAMTDEDVKPFAGLAALRDKLAGDGGEDGGESDK